MSTDGLPPLRDVIAAHGLAAKKSLGQHFLLDLNLTDKIARLADIAKGDHVIEVGPGPGGLTRALLARGAKVTAIERDSRCLAALAEIEAAYPGDLHVFEGDALDTDYRRFARAGAPLKFVSNLPYNISTELLTRWLAGNHSEASALWSTMTLMFQREVADRILAAPGSKTYGRLSVIAQAASAPRRAFDLPARAFTPPPKVDSTVVSFASMRDPLPNLKALEDLTQAAFSQRRKMLRTSMRAALGPSTLSILESVGVSPTARAEELSVAQFVEISRRSTLV